MTAGPRLRGVKRQALSSTVGVGVGVTLGVGVGASAAHGCSIYDVLVIRTDTHTLLLQPPVACSGRLKLIVLDPPTHPSHWLNWNIYRNNIIDPLSTHALRPYPPCTSPLQTNGVVGIAFHKSAGGTSARSTIYKHPRQLLTKVLTAPQREAHLQN